MTGDLAKICWPRTRLGEALLALARKSSLHPNEAETISLPAFVIEQGDDALDNWMDAASRSAEIAAEAVDTARADVCSFLRSCGPALIRLNLLSRTMFLAVIGRRRKALRVLSPDLRIPISTISAALCRELESSLAPEIMLLLDDAGLKGRRRDRALRAMLNERLGTIPIRAGWLLRAPCNAKFSRQLKEARVVPRLALFISATVLDYLLLIGAWWIIGRAALQGRIDYAWFAGWTLILLTRIPLGLLSSWTQGLVTLHTACILKRRLLAGTLRLQPEEIRHEGIGHLLGRVIESEALESLALGGGLSAIVAVAQLIIATVLLASGLHRPVLAALLLVWTLLLCLYSWRYLKRRQNWTDQRPEITNDLVESMAGHRTRLAQQPREQWHIAEDDALQRYAGVSSRMDAAAPSISVIVPRGWLVISLFCAGAGFCIRYGRSNESGRNTGSDFVGPWGVGKPDTNFVLHNGSRNRVAAGKAAIPSRNARGSGRRSRAWSHKSIQQSGRG
jgi:ATP-binding cassette, subfamily B, bacterial